MGDRSSIAGYGLLQVASDAQHVQTFTGDRYAGNNFISRSIVPLRPSYVYVENEYILISKIATTSSYWGSFELRRSHLQTPFAVRCEE